jgi:hypothetical protein
MNKYVLVGMVAIFSCNQAKQKESNIDTLAKPQALPVQTKEVPVQTAEEPKLSGDFNGDGKMEFAYAIKIKEGHGNPVEDGVPDEYAIQFSDTGITSINIGCCEARLINENDLNHDDADEISIFQAPMNGNTYQMTTYTLKGNNWKELIEPFLIPTGGDEVSDKELQERIFIENDALYMYDVDYSDESFKLLKKKVVLK